MKKKGIPLHLYNEREAQWLPWNQDWAGQREESS